MGFSEVTALTSQADTGCTEGKGSSCQVSQAVLSVQQEEAGDRDPVPGHCPAAPRGQFPWFAGWEGDAWRLRPDTGAEPGVSCVSCLSTDVWRGRPAARGDLCGQR